MRAWFMLLLAFPALGAESERETLTRPTQSIALVEAAQHPVMAVWQGGKIYYSDWLENEECLGKNLFVAEERRREPKKIVEIACINSIASDGTNLWVTTPQGVNRLKDNALQSFYDALKEISPPASAKLKALIRVKGISEDALYLAHVSPTTIDLLYRVKAGEKAIYSIVKIAMAGGTTSAELFSTALEISALPPGTAFARGGDGLLYMTDGRQPVGRLLYFATAKDGEPTELRRYYFHADEMPYGGFTDTMPRGKWAARAPRYFTRTPKSFLIFDRNPYDFEQKALAYHDATTKEMVRVAFPAGTENDLGGVSLAEGGLLISHPGARQISWFGRTVPEAIRTFTGRQ